jgi:hypothetical protein
MIMLNDCIRMRRDLEAMHKQYLLDDNFTIQKEAERVMSALSDFIVSISFDIEKIQKDGS